MHCCSRVPRLPKLPALREFAASGRPIWGTCAGLIFLADRAVGALRESVRGVGPAAVVLTRPVVTSGQKQGGQSLIGGLDITVSRNFFGSQIESFETLMPAPALLPSVPGLSHVDPFRAVFIRAPAVVNHGPAVEVLAEYEVPAGKVVADAQHGRVAVAVRQGQLLGTAFHPELTADTRWHRLFVSMCEAAAPTPRTTPPVTTGSAEAQCLQLVPPPALPVF